MSLVLRRNARRLDRAINDLEEATSHFSTSNEGPKSVVESLTHQKHATSLTPIRAKVETILKRYFKRQQKLLLSQISEHLKHVADGNKAVKEAALPDSFNAISYAMPLGYLLPLATTDGMSADYEKALSLSLAAGYTNLADEFDPGRAPSVDYMATYLREHSLTKLTGNLNPTSVDRLRSALATAYEDGATFEEMVDAIKEEYSGFSTVRAGMIAQTESNAAYNDGRLRLGLDMGFNEASWNPDGMACPICLLNALQGWIGIGENFESGDSMPPAHPNCFLAGTPVTALGVSRAFRRRYKGEVCRITIAGRPDLSVTPNHPVLTPRGFVPAGLLNAGDYVIQGLGPSDTAPVLHPDNNYIETAIEQVFDALALSRGGPPTCMPISAEAFHGDASVDGKVDIVDAVGDLTKDNASLLENASALDLGAGYISGAELSAEGSPLKLVSGGLSTPHGGMSGGSAGFPEGWFKAAATHDLSGTVAALGEIQSLPCCEDGGPTDEDSIGDLKQALPFEVCAVKIVRIERFSFDGHVYNLETASGVYTANSIVVHNCDCSLDVRLNNDAG